MLPLRCLIGPENAVPPVHRLSRPRSAQRTAALTSAAPEPAVVSYGCSNNNQPIRGDNPSPSAAADPMSTTTNDHEESHD